MLFEPVKGYLVYAADCTAPNTYLQNHTTSGLCQPLLPRTCCKLADAVRHGEDGRHGPDVRQCEAQLRICHHGGCAVRQAAARQVERGVPAARAQTGRTPTTAVGAVSTGGVQGS